MRFVLALILLASLLGCQGETNHNNAPDTNTVEFNSQEDAQTYSVAILAAIDDLANISRNTLRVEMDEASMQLYKKEGKFSKQVMKNLGDGINRQMTWIKKVRGMTVPQRFRPFHDLLTKNAETKVETLSEILLAMEGTDQKAVQSALDKYELTTKLNRQEMSKLMNGETAEKYLGLKR